MARKQRIVVGFARISSCYGGPEEGGWDYESGYPIEELGYKTFFNSESAREYRDYLRSFISKKNRFAGIGVGGCGDNDDFYIGEVSTEGVDVVMQWRHPSSKGGIVSWPEMRPRYE